ncbi:hypothetical protein [Paenibacillus sp. SI8]|uniref:hypothetical protein n=1 Tax=unclassified Paenibacillus TaxID=185978 RepID=UPI00346762D6
MLSFQQKLEILASFPELERKDVSLGRVNFHYEESAFDKKIVAYHIHPNGNGFVYAGQMKGYATDEKGFVNIRECTADELRALVEKSIQSLTRSGDKAGGKKIDGEERWIDEDDHILTVTFVEDLWYVHAGKNLDAAFETYEEVEEYMQEEGFLRDL